jgi:hypothetical protein
MHKTNHSHSPPQPVKLGPSRSFRNVSWNVGTPFTYLERGVAYTPPRFLNLYEVTIEMTGAEHYDEYGTLSIVKESRL